MALLADFRAGRLALPAPAAEDAADGAAYPSPSPRIKSAGKAALKGRGMCDAPGALSTNEEIMPTAPMADRPLVAGIAGSTPGSKPGGGDDVNRLADIGNVVRVAGLAPGRLPGRLPGLGRGVTRATGNESLPWTAAIMLAAFGLLRASPRSPRFGTAGCENPAACAAVAGYAATKHRVERSDSKNAVLGGGDSGDVVVPA